MGIVPRHWPELKDAENGRHIGAVLNLPIPITACTIALGTCIYDGSCAQPRAIIELKTCVMAVVHSAEPSLNPRLMQARRKSCLISRKKLSEKVVEVCHMPGKGHEILVTSCAIGPFPAYFGTPL